jgi:predicted lipid-binding transport protein (Tim44 family)
MKKFLLSMMVVIGAMSMVVAEAEAARLGGGRSSVGRQSSTVSRQASTPPSQAGKQGQQAAPAAAPAPTPAATPPRQPSRWGGILGGALLGLGLGALLSHMGLGGAAASLISTILMVAILGGIVMLIFRLMKKKPEQPQDRSAYAGGYNPPSASSRTPEIGSGLTPQNPPAAFQADHAPASAAPAVPWGVPADFDVPAFLRSAKAYFIRLQAAWDRGDINDLREFTTSEMFAELRLQLQERGSSPNVTDVVALDADLMGIETVGEEYLASVKFTGQIKESAHAPAEAFNEVWNLSRPISGKSGWLLAGIQQIN